MTSTIAAAVELTSKQSALVWFVTVMLLVLAVELVYITFKLNRNANDMALRRLWNWAHPVATLTVRILVTVAASSSELASSRFSHSPPRAKPRGEVTVALSGAVALIAVGAGCTIYVWVKLRGTVELDLLEEG